MNFKNIDGHEVSLSDLQKLLSYNEIEGLNSNDVTDRVEIFGYNELPKIRIPFWKIYLAPLFNIMITVYLVVVLVYYILALWNPSAFLQASTTFTIIGSNFLVSVVQQYRSTKKIDALHNL
jgi:magnesium-transporting ATPase (P-type)